MVLSAIGGLLTAAVVEDLVAGPFPFGFGLLWGLDVVRISGISPASGSRSARLPRWMDVRADGSVDAVEVAVGSRVPGGSCCLRISALICSASCVVAGVRPRSIRNPAADRSK
ncbi:hypothetical protein, partial [Streptomyces mordarskii]